MKLNLNVHLEVDLTFTKKCSKCGEEKALDCFSKYAKGKFGRQSHCKPCDNADKVKRRAEYSAANELLPLAELQSRVSEKKCGGCKELLPGTEFSRNNTQKSGLRGTCRICESASTSQYRRDNPEKSRGWTEKRRAQKLDLFLEDISYEELVARDGEECAYCHKTGVFLDIEHIWPLALNGWHTPDNLTLACKPCNGSKHATHPAIYVTRENHSPNETVLRALTREHELTRTSTVEEVALCA